MIKKLSLMLVSVLFALFIAEIILRIFSPSFSIMKAGIYEYDKDLGYKLKNNLNVINSYKSETGLSIITNSYGLRDDEVNNKKEKIVLCLGDSHTFGLGVDQIHSYPEQLEDIFQKESPYNIEVLNAGVPAYGWLEQKILLERILNLYSVDLIVMQVSWNDVNDNGIGIPKYLIDKNGNLIQSNVKRRPGGFGKWGMKTEELSSFQIYALKNSHLATLIINHWNKFLYKLNSKEIDNIIAKRKWEESENVLKEIKYLASLNKKPLIVFVHPGIRFEKYHKRSKMIKRIENMLEQNDMVFYSLYDLMGEDLKNQDMYIENDEHFSARGYKFMAAVVYEKLLEKGFVQGGQNRRFQQQ